MLDIAGNLRAVKDRIAAAARRSGREPEEIALVAVTKKFGARQIREAAAAGVTDIGENYVQEATAKWLEIGPAVRWHFIGHLQRNKVKAAVEIFDMVQSVDSVELAQELGRRSVAAGKTLDALIEVNVSQEATKFGVQRSEVPDLASRIASIGGLRVQGLMGMAPYFDDPEQARPHFASLKELFDRLPDEQRAWLSMGMTQDFEIAIEEGSNMVRIGTAIFGPRG